MMTLLSQGSTSTSVIPDTYMLTLAVLDREIELGHAYNIILLYMAMARDKLKEDREWYEMGCTGEHVLHAQPSRICMYTFFVRVHVHVSNGTRPQVPVHVPRTFRTHAR